MKVYLAGPMTGIPEFNFPAFRDACAWLRERGWEVVSPHEIDYGETDRDRGSQPYGVYLRAGLSALLTCNSVVALPGHERSRGCRLELSVAVTCGMPVYGLDTLKLSR